MFAVRLIANVDFTFIAEQPSDPKLLSCVDGIVVALLRRIEQGRGSHRINESAEVYPGNFNRRGDLGIKRSTRFPSLT